MKVRLKTGFWEVRDYIMSVDGEGLVFVSDEKELRIPFSGLERFSLTGSSTAPDRFTIDAGDQNYSGRFINPADAKKAIEKLRKRLGQRIEINLTSE